MLASCYGNRSTDGAVGSIHGPGVTCGLSLLLVLVLAARVSLRFSSEHKNQHANFQLVLDARMPSRPVLELFGITWINKLPFRTKSGKHSAIN